jgi:hypothetical protein
MEEVVDKDHVREPGVQQLTNYKWVLKDQKLKGKGRYVL